MKKQKLDGKGVMGSGGDLWMVLNGDLENMRVGEKGLVMRERKRKLKRGGREKGGKYLGFYVYCS